MHKLAVWVGLAWALSGCLYFDIDVGDEPGDAGGPRVDAHPADAAPDLSDCDVDLPCLAPARGHTQICGRIHDTQTSAAIVPDTPLQVSFHDYLQFANVPDSPPLVTTLVDACGRFSSAVGTSSPGGIPLPSTQYVAVVVDDAPGGADLHVPTEVTVWGVELSAVGARVYATRPDTLLAWQTAAQTSTPMEVTGVALVVFVDPTAGPTMTPLAGVPRAGVTFTDAGRAPLANAYYFADGAPLSRASLDPEASHTGPNGSALIVEDQALVSYSGAGQEPSGCDWQTHPMRTIPGVVSIHENDAICP